MEKIAATVVTFNRPKLLRECLDALVRQTRVPDKVFIIDNCSTDETPVIGKEYAKRYPQVQYVRLSSNTGGAGGFHTGMKLAYDEGFDWIWVMDDDVEPYSDALEGLLKYKGNGLCIHGQRINYDGSPCYWEARFNSKIGFAIPYPDKSFKEGKKFCEVNVGCFEGMLVHRDIVQKVGFPDPRFFITWDDTVYGFLASKFTKVLYVPHKSLRRKRKLEAVNVGVRTLTISSDLFKFYHIRNRALVKHYIKNEPEYSSFLFGAMTCLLFTKELIRNLIFQKNLRAFKPLWRGLLAGIRLDKEINKNPKLVA